MITRHTTANKAHHDVEFWLSQGYAVGILWPNNDDEFFTVYIDLLKGR